MHPARHPARPAQRRARRPGAALRLCAGLFARRHGVAVTVARAGPGADAGAGGHAPGGPRRPRRSTAGRRSCHRSSGRCHHPPRSRAARRGAGRAQDAPPAVAGAPGARTGLGAALGRVPGALPGCDDYPPLRALACPTATCGSISTTRWHLERVM
ncbi:MAG: hypothetical protein ACK559_09035 [bacterium]